MIYGDKETKTPDINAIAQSNNLYAYCMNNPVNFADADGEAAELAIMALYTYIQAVMTSPDLQYDTQMLAFDISEGDYLSAAFDAVDILLPGFSGSKSVPKFFRKYFDGIVESISNKRRLVNSINGLPKNTGYDSFDALKKAIGSAGEGKHWHHIVEQSQIEKSGFSPQKVHNTSNIIAVDATTHSEITGHYNTKSLEFTSGKSVRDWLAGQSYETQYEYGIKILKDFGVIK